MTDELLFPDPQQFDLERAKLARRRKIAESLIATQADAPRMMGNWVLNTGPAGSVAASIARGLGQHETSKLDEQDKLLHANENRAQRNFLESNGLSKLAPGLELPTLRDTIKQQIGQELDYPRQREQEAARQAIEDARIKASDEKQAKLFTQQTELLDKRLAGQKELRQMPTIHISNSGGSSPGDEFAISLALTRGH